MRNKTANYTEIMHRLFYFLLLVALGFAGCADKEDEAIVLAPEISGIESKYSILENEELELTPVIANDNQSVYSWFVDGKEVATTLEYTFVPTSAGEFKLIFKAENKGGADTKEITVTVVALGEPPVITQLEDEYEIAVGKEQKLTPIVVSDTEVTYSWLLGDEEVSSSASYTFVSSEPGKFVLLLKAENRGGISEKSVTVLVNPNPVSMSVETNMLLYIETPDYAQNAEEIIWSVEEAESELYRLSYEDTKSPIFVAVKEGKYKLNINADGVKGEINVTVGKRSKQASPYISEVFDYMPAPGQFVNELPKYEPGDTHKDMVRKAGEWLVGEDAWMITLGGWGGYVTVGFDHTIVNVPGKRDFRINGNAFGAAMGRPNAPFGGSCEPGIIMVAYDKNKNGKPDEDEWYEIKGSSNFSAKDEPWYDFAVGNGNDVRVFRDYQITYHKPLRETPELEGDMSDPGKYASIQNYIKWEDNQSNSGYKVKNIYHTQSYYPAWVGDNTLTFKGIRLPENGINEGQFVPGINDSNIYFVLYGFRYGYVDNHPNTQDGSAIDIDWAIDKDGNKVNLPGIDFVKIYNGVNQENGWLGETSTEVERGEDLHLLGKSIDTIKE